MAETIVLTVDGVLDRAAIPALCERLRQLLASDDGGHAPVICDVGRLGTANMAALDALARLQLTALQCGRRIRLRDASAELQALLGLTGLNAVLPLEPPSGQMRWQAEEREESCGVEEEGDAGDPSFG